MSSLTEQEVPKTSLEEVIQRLGPSPRVGRLPAPPYTPPLSLDTRTRVGLVVEDMRRDMTSEGYQIFQGLEQAGYALTGYNLLSDLTTPSWNKGVYRCNLTDTSKIINQFHPSVVLVQDQREWDPSIVRHRNRSYAFTGIELLKQRPDIFKLTIVKDAHQRPEYHRASAERMGAHGIITYYHPRIICHLAPYIRPEHLVRTYHTVDPDEVPPFNSGKREGCVLSGATGRAYPLRTRLSQQIRMLARTKYLPHPGYGNRGCHTPLYLRQLSNFKISICTSSIYGYSLRKLVESTAVGCRVITDLPVEDELPWIDGNLVRISSNVSMTLLNSILQKELAGYDLERQKHFADLAIQHYNPVSMCQKLSDDIETLRASYP